MPSARWLPSKNGGTGNPSIMCPIEKYISTSRNTSEDISRLSILGVSVSLISSDSFAAFFAPLTDAS